MVGATGQVQSEGGLNRQGHGHHKVVSLRRIGTIPGMVSADAIVAVDLSCAGQSEPEGAGDRGKHLASFRRHPSSSVGPHCIILEGRHAHISIDAHNKCRNRSELSTHLKKIATCIEILNRPMGRVRPVNRDARNLTCKSAYGQRETGARGVGEHRGSVFFVKGNATTSPRRVTPNKQMTPLDRVQCVQMSISPLRIRIERAILRQRQLEKVNNPFGLRKKKIIDIAVQ